jgi:hypothetical protein
MFVDAHAKITQNKIRTGLQSSTKFDSLKIFKFNIFAR